MTKPLVFISHITEEAELAAVFKTEIERVFLGLVEVFVSSDSKSISVGKNWLDEITNGLRSAQAMILFCSPLSITRPWINFEAGAGWARDIPIVPLCHSGLRPVELPLPLTLLQGMIAHDESKIIELFDLIAKQLKSATPTINANAISNQVSSFEAVYTIEVKAAAHLRAIANSWPELIAAMKGAGSHPFGIAGIGEWKVNLVRQPLEHLKSAKLVDYSFSVTSAVFGGSSGGSFGDLTGQCSSDLLNVLKTRY